MWAIKNLKYGLGSIIKFVRCERPARRRANLSIRPAQSLFPEFYYSGRKFTPSDPGAQKDRRGCRMASFRKTK